MFDREHVPLKVTDVTHIRKEQEEKEIPLVVMALELHPLSAEVAAEISAFMKSTLYTVKDAAVNPQLTAATFQVCDREQDLVFRMAPDQVSESFRAIGVTIGPCKVSRNKTTPTWKLRFTATFEPMGEHHLAQIVDSLTKFRYVTFGDSSPNLVTEAQRADRQTAAAAAEGETEGEGEGEEPRKKRATRSTARAH